MIKKMTSNWLVRKPTYNGWFTMLTMALVIFVISFSYFINVWQMQEWAPVSYQTAISMKEFWRLWTGLFVHADLEHFLSNFVLFVPLTFLLSGYYGSFLFPVLGIFVGGLINLMTIHSMNETTGLLGMSGVIYWMGSVWMTLYFLIDKRSSPRKRFAVSLFLTLMLFSSESYKPNVSYTSHLLGFILGIISGYLYYYWNQNKFLAAEEYIHELEEEDLVPTEATGSESNFSS